MTLKKRLFLQWKSSVILGSFVWRVYIIFSHSTRSIPSACVRAWGRIVGGRCAWAGAGGRQRRCSLSVSPARRRGALRHAAPRILSTSSTASILLLSCRIVSWVCVYSVVPGSLSVVLLLLLFPPGRSEVMHPPPYSLSSPHTAVIMWSIRRSIHPRPRTARCSNVLTELHGNSVSPQ